MIRLPITQPPSFRLLSFSLMFIFGGAIIGETVAISMVISVAGAGILSRLYLINGILLLGLPIFFLNKIDKFSRDRMLSVQLVAAAAILVAYLGVFYWHGAHPSAISRFLMFVIYPVSYLSKTVLFLTFWTLANDVCRSVEAKKEFPIIAAWGFVGGLAGACCAQVLLRIVGLETIVWLWIAFYTAAWFVVRRIRVSHEQRLRHRENEPESGEPVVGLVRDVLEIRLVRVIGVLYFLVFVAIFSMDYLFWKQCHERFPLSGALASFQFSFYLIHAVITIAGLWFVTPRLINRWGFANMLFFLPGVLLATSIALIGGRVLQSNNQVFFATFVVFQVFRYVVFENAFSPIYQLFFTAIPKERRGRAKMFLEGIIKPAAIFTSGLYLTVLEHHPIWILAVVGAAGGGMLYLVARIRRSYMEEFIPRQTGHGQSSDLVAEFGARDDLKIVSLIKEYTASPDPELRSLAVRILAKQASRTAFKTIQDLYAVEKDSSVRELLAHSLAGFYGYEAKVFIEELFRDGNPRVRANAVFSANEMNCHWKVQLCEAVRSMLFENNLRVQIEAARFLWVNGEHAERQNIRAFIASLLGSRNSNRRAAGLYLVGALQPDRWEEILLTNLRSISLQVFTKSMETILRFASDKTKAAALRIVEDLSREQIDITGRVAQSMGEPIIAPLVAYLRQAQNRRMLFEVVRALRVIRFSRGVETLVMVPLDRETETALLNWIRTEAEKLYRDAFIWQRQLISIGESQNLSSLSMLDDALRTRVYRIVEWMLDGMVLLDKEGMLTWGRRDLDLSDQVQRLDMVEILENLGSHRIASMVVPLLRFESWDDVARAGRTAFKFADDQDSGLAHFVQSENKWVALCALYGLFQTQRPEKMVAAVLPILERLTDDPYPYIARTARQLIDKKDSRGKITVETFNLLETVLFLKHTPMFRNITGEHLIGLAEIFELKSFKRGTVLSREGDIADHLYIVLNGSLEIVKNQNGRPVVLMVIRSGEMYGEIGLFNQAPRSASAVAGEECELFVVQRGALKKLLMSVPAIAYNFLEILSDRLRLNGEELVNLRSQVSARNVPSTVNVP